LKLLELVFFIKAEKLNPSQISSSRWNLVFFPSSKGYGRHNTRFHEI